MASQQDTIPAQVHIGGFNSLNFGIGGYSTAAELPTFIEAMRKYSSILTAVFYDGVNKIGVFLMGRLPPVFFHGPTARNFI